MSIKDTILTSLTTLSLQKQLAFALLLFERMVPELIAFSKSTGFDDSCYFRAKDLAWASLRGNDNHQIRQILNDQCASNAPDTENFSHQLTSYALNAALAMSDIMELTLDGCVDHVADVSTLAQDSLYLYLSSLDSSISLSAEDSRRLAEHPLMLQEQRREADDISFLLGLADHLDEDAIVILKERAGSQAPLLPCSL